MKAGPTLAQSAFRRGDSAKFFRLGLKVLSGKNLSAIMDKVEKIDAERDVGTIARMMTVRSS